VAVVIAGVTSLASSALAADAANGQRLARQRCAPCHVVVPEQRQEVANSPPFTEIALKFADADIIVGAILDRHSRMNVTVSRAEAADLAAYIQTLKK
jgi:mono/diheme cytochrome c family protein